jgi:pilus assembly protein FimV
LKLQIGALGRTSGPHWNLGACKRFALTHVTVAVLAAASSGAWGLGLGRLTVQSALGETLKAEIDITSLSPEEAGTLKVRIAPPDSYRATGVEYNAVLTGTQVQVTRRDGRTFLRVSSDRAVQEPFVDVILELSWASGRLVREYTLLFDPPANPRPLGTPAPAAIAAAPLISPAPLPPPAPAEAAAVPAPAAALAQAIPPVTAAPAAAASRPRPEPRPVVVPRPPAPPSASANPAASAAATAGSQYPVKSGDTLYRVATKTQAPGVSLDQMLVGLYRNNPDAFVNSNMNRLKAGVVLQVPASESLQAVSPAQARQVIQAQSADFGAYRQRLAAGVPTLKPEESPQQAKGRVQAAVEDRKAMPVTPDKLTLSKAASANAEAKASKDTEKKDAAARVAELQRNVEELQKLSSAAKPAAASPAPKAVPADVPAPAPTVVATAAPPAPPVPTAKPASEPSRLPTTAVALPVPAAPASAAVAAAASAALPEPQTAEPGLLDQLLGNSLLLPLGGVLLAALGALGFYRLRSRKSAQASDTGFNESKLQPDSFFGATGGQRVDTRDASGAASSMNYSLSQLDAIGDVDPVAEADVYLAYGRDLQAEEILKEALRANPERLAIRLKLLEVYAKRRDTKGFEQLAIQLCADTEGRGGDWELAQEMGRLIDADNPLYQPGGMPGQAGSAQQIRPAAMGVIAAAAYLATEPVGHDTEDSRPMGGPVSGLDLDLDLDLDAPPPMLSSSMEATQAMSTSVERLPLAMDFDLSDEPLSSSSPPAAESMSSLAFDLDEFSLLDGEDAAAPPIKDMGNALDFDLSSIDLALPDLPETPVAAEPAALQLDEFSFDLSDQPADELPEALAEELPVAIPAADSLVLDGELPDEFAQLLRDSELSDSAAETPDAGAELPVEASAELSANESANAAAAAFDPFAADDEDPLMRQLELADEFRQIGDTEGAREVLQELIGKASGPVLEKAQALLNELH